MQRFWPTIRLIFVVNLVYFKVLADGLFTYLMRKSIVARKTLLKKKNIAIIKGKKCVPVRWQIIKEFSS